MNEMQFASWLLGQDNANTPEEWSTERNKKPFLEIPECSLWQSTFRRFFSLSPNVKDIRAGIWPNLWVKKVVLFSFNNKIFYI